MGLVLLRLAVGYSPEKKTVVCIHTHTHFRIIDCFTGSSHKTSITQSTSPHRYTSPQVQRPIHPQDKLRCFTTTQRETTPTFSIPHPPHTCTTTLQSILPNMACVHICMYSISSEDQLLTGDTQANVHHCGRCILAGTSNHYSRLWCTHYGNTTQERKVLPLSIEEELC